MNTHPTLYIFSGLPGTGKTTLAQELSKILCGTYLRIDTIEQGIRDLCSFDVTSEGYGLCYRIATDNLVLGKSVLADSCNPVEITRQQWMDVAIDSGALYINIEIVCSDEAEHRQRIETRKPGVTALQLPTWREVLCREYHPWNCDRVVIDTAGKSISSCVAELRLAIKNASAP